MISFESLASSGSDDELTNSLPLQSIQLGGTKSHIGNSKVSKMFQTPKLSLIDAEIILRELQTDASREWTPLRLLESLDKQIVS